MLASSGFRGVPTDRPPDASSDYSFPKNKCVLWDKSSTGQPIFLHIGYYRRPKVCIPNKVLKLVQHQCENYGQVKHALIGSLVIEDDCEGVQLQVDRLDTRGQVLPGSAGLVPGDLLIPIDVSNNQASEKGATVEEFTTALKRLQEVCCGKASIELSNFILVRGRGSFYSNMHSSVLHLDFDMVTMASVFKATPIMPVPIVLTALSKNLAGPMSLSHTQGVPKSGYLTMDHTRKLLLVLESDPKVASLPIVGIWVSGTMNAHHPFVWAACLRYVYSTHLNDRVCAPPDDFLLVVYTPLHSKPEFYQCCTTDLSSDLKFQLYSGREVGNINKELSQETDDFIEILLDPEHDERKFSFETALDRHRMNGGSQTSMTSSEDIEPRSAPTPHSEKVPTIRPMVPDVSILWTNSLEESVPLPYPQPFTSSHSRPTTQMQNAYQFSMPVISQHIPPHQSYTSGNIQNCSPRLELPYTTAGGLNLPQNGFRWQSVPQTNSNAVTSLPHPSQQLLQNRTNALHLPQASSASHSSSGPYVQPQTNAPHLPQASYVSFSRSGPFVQSSPVSVGREHTCAPTPRTLAPHIATQDAQIRYCNPPASVPVNPVVPSSYVLQMSAQHQGQLTDSSISTIYSHSTPRPNMTTANFNPQPSYQTRSTIPNISTTPHHLVPNGANQQPQGIRKCIPCTGNVAFTPAPTSVQHQQATCANICQPHRQIHSQTSGGINRGPHHMPVLESVIEESSSLSGKRKDNQSIGHLDGIAGATNNIANHSDLSGGAKSSDDDSGLSITPERGGNPSPPQARNPETAQPPTSQSSTFAAASSELTMNNINWEPIPTEIKALFLKQNEQLEMLRLQVQSLLANQSQGSVASNNSLQTGNAQSHQKSCAVEVNTGFAGSSMDESCRKPNQLASPNLPRHSPSSQIQDRPSDRINSHHIQADFSSEPVLSARSNSTVPGNHGHREMSSIMNTSTETQTQKSSSPESSGDRQSNSQHMFSTLADTPVFEETINTTGVQEVVDMPEYDSSNHSESDSDQNFTSASQCFQNQMDDSYSTVGEDATDPKQFYSQLMNNIQLFLTNEKHESSDQTQTADQTDLMSQSMPGRLDRRLSELSNSTPEANYLSMLLGSATDAGQSMEINAMAMKYLNDEQLTHMARLSQDKGGGGLYASKILQQVVGWGKHSFRSEASQSGISPNDMTMATRNYMEKHGLLGNDQSMGVSGLQDFSFLNDSLKLNTNFSIATNGTADVREKGQHKQHFQSQDFDDGDCTSVLTPNSLPKKGPPHTEMRQGDGPFLFCNLQDQQGQEKEKVNGGIPKDLGASPVLSSQRRYNVDNAVGAMQNAVNKFAGRKARKDNNYEKLFDNNEDEDDNILDIAKLKQLPKLL